MFLDASVIVAILLREDGFEDIVKRIEGHSKRIYCSPLARFEASVSLARALNAPSRLTPDLVCAAQDDVNTFLTEIDARDVTITTGIGQAAIDAAGRYGKVVGHPAALNFGDCFSYACAKTHRLPLLYKGNDFNQTDLA